MKSSQSIIVEIDPFSGFCFGVKNAIDRVETELGNGLICSLGSIVHNAEEVARLEKMGMQTISKANLSKNKGKKVLIRTHGEPPETYIQLEKNSNDILDATCPIVKKIQVRIKKAAEQAKSRNGQLLIYGHKSHAEVVGLIGHSGNYAKVIEKEDDLYNIDFSRPIEIFSQTTMHPEGLNKLKHIIEKNIRSLGLNPSQLLQVHNTICGQVSGREDSLREFARKHDLVLFVSGKDSSNGSRLFTYCKAENPRSYFISNSQEIDGSWLKDTKSIGISGATSTPSWLMEDVKKHIINILSP